MQWWRPVEQIKTGTSFFIAKCTAHYKGHIFRSSIFSTKECHTSRFKSSQCLPAQRKSENR